MNVLYSVLRRWIINVVDDIHKPKPFLRFRLRVVVAFFIICMLVCLVYYMILANADPSHIITGALPAIL